MTQNGSYYILFCLLAVAAFAPVIKGEVVIQDSLFGDLVPSLAYPGFLTHNTENYRDNILILATNEQLRKLGLANLTSQEDQLKRWRRQTGDDFCAEPKVVRNCLKTFCSQNFVSETLFLSDAVETPKIRLRDFADTRRFQPLMVRTLLDVHTFIRDRLQRRLAKMFGDSRLQEAVDLANKLLDCSTETKKVSTTFDINEDAIVYYNFVCQKTTNWIFLALGFLFARQREDKGKSLVNLTMEEREQVRKWVYTDLHRHIITQFEINIVRKNTENLIEGESSTAVSSTTTTPIASSSTAGSQQQAITTTLPTTSTTDKPVSLTRGMDFVFTWLQGIGNPQDAQLSFIVVNDNDEAVDVTWANAEDRLTSSATLGPNTFKKVPVSWRLQAGQKKLDYGWTADRIAMNVRSTKDVSILALNVLTKSKPFGRAEEVTIGSETSVDAFIVVPRKWLGTQYLSGAGSSSDLRHGKKRPRQMAITASEDWTTVMFKNNQGNPYSKTALKFDVMSYSNEEELNVNGFHVNNASKPVAVASGVQCKLHYGCDSKVEMLFPVNLWDKKYLLAPLGDPSFLQAYFIQVLAAEDSTQVFVDDKLQATLSTGKTHEFYLLGRKKEAILTSTKPVSVLLNGYRDFSILIPPVSQYLSGTIGFYVPEGLQDYSHKLTIIADQQCQGNMKLDSESLSEKDWDTLSNSTYSHLSLSTVSPGLRTLECGAPGGRFTVLVYGHDKWRGYGYAAGRNIWRK